MTSDNVRPTVESDNGGNKALLDSDAECYCPHCGAAYVDRASECEHCPGVALTSEPPSPSDMGEAVRVAEFFDWLAAENLRLSLEEAGIPARYESSNETGSFVFGVASPFASYRLLIPSNCVPRARPVLDGLQGSDPETAQA